MFISYQILLLQKFQKNIVFEIIKGETPKWKQNPIIFLSEVGTL